MIDFTKCPINEYRAYGGANGNKINICYDEKSYMLKFPPVPSRNKAMSYSNSCISEYIACHIFEALGFKTQETLLGNYTDKRGRKKIVVACRDFTDRNHKLVEFAQLKNTCIHSEQQGYGTELSTILEAIEEQSLVSPAKLREFFWEMFIVDALVGNFDRHNGNWGLLVDEENRTADIAPVYDCGSCLYPQLAVEDMRRVLESEEEINQRIYTFPASIVEENGKKIPYFSFLSSLKNDDCNRALKRIHGRINMEIFYEIIDHTPTLLPVQREFYKIMLYERKTKILDYGMERLSKTI